MVYKDFYAELGKLLYAIADIDGVITKQEKNRLQEIVKRELVPSEEHTDKFGTDTAYYSEMEFNFLEEQIADAESAFESFIDYIEEHRTALDEPMKKVCLHIASELAAAYHGTNKKEKALIKKLQQKLKTL